jgi:hypothetical protein
MANWKLISPASGPERAKPGRAVVTDDAGKALLVAAGWISVGLVFANDSLQFPSGTISWAGLPHDLQYDQGFGSSTRGKVLGFIASNVPNPWSAIGAGPWPAAVGALCQNSSTSRWHWFDGYQWRGFHSGAFAGPVPYLPAS